MHLKKKHSAGNVLELENLSKQFGSNSVLHSLDLVVPAGSLTVILGPAGAGKTTTLRLIAGLEVPTTGAIRIESRDVTYLTPNKRDVAMVFDNLALYPNKSGFENMANPLRIGGVKDDEVNERVHQVAELLRIPHVLDRQPRTMSGGERQRVALGRTFVRQPALFLLDEPLSNLDAMLRLEMRAELKRLQRDLGYSFVFATPDFTEALALADEVIFLYEGKIHQGAPPHVLYDRPADIRTARFVGTPEINILPAEYEPSEGGRILCGGMIFPVTSEFHREFEDERTLFQAGIRPEDITIHPRESGSIRGKVVDVEPHGVKSAAIVDLPDCSLRITVDANTTFVPKMDEIVSVEVALERLHAFDYETGIRLF